MPKRSDPENTRDALWDKLIGLGEQSLHKSYYPELQRQLDNLRERVELAELVAEVGRALTEELTLRESLQRCSDTLVRRTDAAFVRIWTLDRDDSTLELQASSGLHTNLGGRHSRISLNDYPYKIGMIAREKQPYLTNDVIGNPQFHDQQWVRDQGVVAFAGYPLLLQQRLVGVIALFAQKLLNDTLLDTLATIINQVAVSIERFRAIEAYKAALSNARHSHDKVTGILRSVADALLVIDNTQRIVHMNQAAEALLGVALATAVQKRVDQISREPELLDYLARIESFTDPDEDIDLELTDRSCHEQRIIQARCARLTGAQTGSGVVISLRDVTHDRNLARLKSEFITTAAHELRTPLTVIRGYADLMADQEWDAATRRDYLQQVLDKTDRLEQIIDDLLDLNRIESGRGLILNCSDWSPATLLENTVAHYRREAPTHRVELALGDLPELLHADQGKVQQLLDNLLVNAVKYSPEGGVIRLQAAAANQELVVSVNDQGIGMTASQVSKCCDKFYRADSSDTAVGGLGLGLSIARQIVAAHNGTIRIDSSLGQGTTVTFTLPLDKRARFHGR